MRVLLTGGGTAGHISPALAVADYIKKIEPDSKFLYIGNMDKMESELVPKAGYDFLGIKTSGFSRKISFKGIKQNLKALYQTFKANSKVKKAIEEFSPDFIFATSGYVSAPAIKQAIKLKVPIFIHSSDAYPGVVTKYYADKVTCLLLGSKDIKQHLKKYGNIEVVGTPISEKILNANRKKARNKLGLADDDFLVLTTGGSLGSKTLNQYMIHVMNNLKKEKNIIFIHGMGTIYTPYFEEYLKEEGFFDINNYKNNIRIFEYIYNMEEYLVAADVVVARAGINTVNEIGAVGVASILVPSPNVTENHQYYNAMVLGKRGASIVIEEKDLTRDILLTEVKRLYNNKNEAKKMGQLAKKEIEIDATSKIYETIKLYLK